MEILTTKDYSKFKTIVGNRGINRKKVSKLVNDIDNGLNLLPYCPILVSESNGYYYIIDGQYRFSASKETNHFVYYIICRELELKEIARLNSRSDKWKNSDFLNCYIQIGIKDYENLKEVINQYRIPYSTAIGLLDNFSVKYGGNKMEQFRDGNFKCNYLKMTKELLDFVESLFGRYKFCFDRGLIDAVMRIKAKGVCEFDILKTKIKKNTNLMEKKTTHKEYCNDIERVYNQRNQKRISIY